MRESRNNEYRHTTVNRRQWHAERFGRRVQTARGTKRALSAFGIIWPVAVVILDTATGRHALLLVLLSFGPCVAVLSERRVPTIAAGLLAVAAAMACGVPDGIFGSGEHLLLIASVTAVAGVAVIALKGETRHSPPPRPRRR